MLGWVLIIKPVKNYLTKRMSENNNGPSHQFLLGPLLFWFYGFLFENPKFEQKRVEIEEKQASE